MKSKDIPAFGPLQGLKVVHASVSIAGPYCASIMADLGAQVTWIENPKGLDIARGGGFHQGWQIEMNRRNMRSLTLNIPSPEGREVFLKLM
ncbi:MAG: CoA transferase, partial [Eggerthellaceae bacterium]|nr:CoA transferase [Eggerthellaceae bacterium]